MIAADLMYKKLDIRLLRRRTLRRSILIILGVAVINTLVAVTLMPNGPAMWPAVLCSSLIFSNCIGWLFWLLGPPLRVYIEPMKPVPKWTIRIVVWAAITNAGALLAI